MDPRRIDKSRLPSRYVTEGVARAPRRSHLYAMELINEQIHRPPVGVAACWNEAASCDVLPRRLAQAVKTGVAAAAGTSGHLWKYAQGVGPAASGAVTHPGGAHELESYADL